MEGTRKAPAVSTMLLKQLGSFRSFLTTGKTVAFAYGFLTAFVFFTIFLAFSVSTKPSGNRNGHDSAGNILLTEEILLGSALHSVSANRCISTFYRSYQQEPFLPPPPATMNLTETHEALNPENEIRIVAAPAEERRNSAAGKWEDRRESLNGTGNFSQVNNFEREAVPDSPSKTPSAPVVTLAGDSGTTSGDASMVIKEINGGNSSTGLGRGSRRRRSRKWPMNTSRRAGAGGDGGNAECNIFEGRWVRDDSYPLYAAGSCPFVHEPVNCIKNGRPDSLYEKWRWQPKGCNIPRLEGKAMLERLRGKRLAFVGDSLNRNMWASLICILWSSVEDKRRVQWAMGRRQFGTPHAGGFTFMDYNCSVEFFWSAFLVEEVKTGMPDGTTKATLKLDTIASAAASYKDADILVFNSGHWFTPSKTNNGKDFYQVKDRVLKKMSDFRGYKRALNTWARWLDANVNPKKTMVFFRGYTNPHYWGGEWNTGGFCHNQAEPIRENGRLPSHPPKAKALESVIHGMKTPISYLNVTKMSDYRKDGHPSIYTKPKLSAEERKAPPKAQDCNHWCLPGVPDSWNELLYAKLLMT
ncbi:trichome birefringence-like 1 protein [Nymphaea thermarum]|nr:trichome birefringence-like 1 protein [Nymphaea thermarum]